MRELSLTQLLCSSWLGAGNYHLKAAAVRGEIRKAGSYDNRGEGKGREGKGREGKGREDSILETCMMHTVAQTVTQSTRES